MTALSRTAEFGITGVFEVGGHVRDGLLGLVSKDVDYAVEVPSFAAMDAWARATHSKVFDIPGAAENYTVRALGIDGPKDYVMCRKDGPYSDGRHPDWVSPGTIFDDLARRDFTVNAIARNAETGEILDPHNGQEDLVNKRLACVGSARARFMEDPLRIIRAIRFAITKDFVPDEQIQAILMNEPAHDLDTLWWPRLVLGVQPNRVRDELTKCFVHDTVKTLNFLSAFVAPEMTEALFGKGIWLKPTSEGK